MKRLTRGARRVVFFFCLLLWKFLFSITERWTNRARVVIMKDKVDANLFYILMLSHYLCFYSDSTAYLHILFET